jgi:hypothetical protein
MMLLPAAILDLFRAVYSVPIRSPSRAIVSCGICSGVASEFLSNNGGE